MSVLGHLLERNFIHFRSSVPSAWRHEAIAPFHLEHHGGRRVMKGEGEVVHRPDRGDVPVGRLLLSEP